MPGDSKDRVRNVLMWSPTNGQFEEAVNSIRNAPKGIEGAGIVPGAPVAR